MLSEASAIASSSAVTGLGTAFDRSHVTRNGRSNSDMTPVFSLDTRTSQNGRSGRSRGSKAPVISTREGGRMFSVFRAFGGLFFAHSALRKPLGLTMKSTRALAFLAAGMAACSTTGTSTNGGVAPAGTNQAQAGALTCAPDNAGIVLPAGFCAGVFADSLGRARYLTVASNGDVYVALEGTRPPPQQGAPPAPQKGAFAALRDTNNDGRADRIEYVGTRGNTGIALHGGYLY